MLFFPAKEKVASWFNKKTFKPEKLRGILMGITLATTLGEVCVYKLIKQDIEVGELPPYTTGIF